ncbi:MAG: hypothetical protein RI973_1177 [Bacteroidota bacterium]|jgi:hypothetical protein
MNTSEVKIPKMNLKLASRPGRQHQAGIASWTFLFFLALPSWTAAQLSITLQVQAPTCGNLPNGVINANVSGGIPPYSFLWSNGATNNPIANLPGGNYSVTVTSNNGLTASASVTLPSPPPLVATISTTNCILPGELTVNVSGGSPPYFYFWNNGGNSETIVNLSPGIYCVNVLDAANCGVSVCGTIYQPLNLSLTSNPVICGSNGSGGSASATVTGGDAPYSYSWSTGATTASISNLPAGNYQLTVTGENGCTATSSTVISTTPGNMGVSLALTQPTCPASNTGSITANVSNGTAPYSFIWNNGQSTATISNLVAGAYQVTATDAYGCTAAQSTSLTNQSNLSLTLNLSNPTCIGSGNGAVTALVANGVAPYSYAWSTGANTPGINMLPPGTYSVTVTDQIGCTRSATTSLTAPPPFPVIVNATNATSCGVPNGALTTQVGAGATPPLSYLWSNGATTANLSVLPAGTYSVTITTALGCTSTGTATVNEPNLLNVSISGSTQVCGTADDGTLTANYANGTAPYAYAWSNGQNTETVTGLGPGNYSVTVTSSQGCIGSASTTISAVPGIDLDVVTLPVSCFGQSDGQAAAIAIGGLPPLTYLWENGNNTPSLDSLAAGDYGLTVTDDIGCTASITASIVEPEVLQLDLLSSGGSCDSMGSITVMASGGTPGYSYTWNTGDTSQAISQLPPGDYSVTVVDENGCTAESQLEIVLFQTPSLQVNAMNTSCGSINDGTVSAIPSGGLPPYSYLWSNGQTEASVGGIAPGDYTVTITDSNGCTQTGGATVLLGTGLNLSIAAPTYICEGQTGTATANAVGGQPPYTYHWMSGQSTQSISGLLPSTYAVTVSDVNGCSGSGSVTLLPVLGMALQADISPVACHGTATGIIDLLVNGGTPPFDYSWSTGDTTALVDSLATGSYAVTVTDSTLCVITGTFAVNQPNPLGSNLNVSNGNCVDVATAGALANGGVPPYNYQWSTGESGQFIANLDPGIYYLSVTDANSCLWLDSFEITPIPLPTCTVEVLQPISDVGLSDGQLSVVTEGGTPPFLYSWNVGSSSATIINLFAGLYQVTVTDSNSCKTICNFTLLSPARTGNFTWLDQDEDGIQDSGEPGLEGVSVALSGTDYNGNDVNLSTQSDPDGNYSLLLLPGDYKITFSPPAGFGLSPANQGNDDSSDSDAQSATGETAVFALASAQTNLDMDAGFHPVIPCDNVTTAGQICCDQTLCGPGNAVDPLLSVQAAGGGSGDLEYRWFYSLTAGDFDPDSWTVVPGAVLENFVPAQPDQTIYYTRVARRNGCPDFLPSNIVAIEIDSIANAEISGAPAGICLGQPLAFEALDNGPLAQYSWSFEDGDPDTATTRVVPEVFWSTTGVKQVVLEVQVAQCTSRDTLSLLISNQSEFCGDALVIDARLAEDTLGIFIEWFYEKSDSVERSYQLEYAWESEDFSVLDVPIDESFYEDDTYRYLAFHPDIKRGQNRYRVRLEDSNGNVLYSNIATVYYQGDYRFVHIFPNPFSDALNIEVIDWLEGLPLTLELVTAEGRILDVYEVLSPPAAWIEVSTKDYAPGMYFLQVKYDGKLQKIFKLAKWQ